jgi:2-aminophenol/2-amino-5-chlorophenol 1,6-dioxygenase alpha subunit
MSVVKGLLVPGLPHPLLCPERNEGWTRLREAFDQARAELLAAKPDVLLVYSTMWPSVVGHQIQADPEPKWVHVDELFHDLGSIPYEFKVDAEFAHGMCDAAKSRGLMARTVAYHGFPIDTGSVVALKLLTPNNEIPACILSSNMYSDRAETVVLGKAATDTLEAQGKTAAAVVVMTLSNRLFTEFIDPAEDRIHSAKDDEWNRKLLEFLGDGRLEDIAQLSREIHRQIRVKKVVNFKPMWWLSSVMGAHNKYEGDVLAYEAIHGTGGAVVSLTPSATGVGDKEYDEEDVDVYRGDRDVLTRDSGAAPEAEIAPTAGITRTEAAPKPVGAYPHARQVGGLLTLSGIGPRTPGTDEIPGGPVRDAEGNALDYDVAAQTRQVIENVGTILSEAGASLEDVFDVTVFLTDMDRDFEAFNEVYRETFESVQATRTTVQVTALPTPIAVEFKVLARAPR